MIQSNLERHDPDLLQVGDWGKVKSVKGVTTNILKEERSIRAKKINNLLGLRIYKAAKIAMKLSGMSEEDRASYTQIKTQDYLNNTLDFIDDAQKTWSADGTLNERCQ